MTACLQSFGKMRIFGHRGASWDEPENTWSAFHKARELGAHGIELDLQLVAGGKKSEIIALHDDTLERTAISSTSGHPISEHTLTTPVLDLDLPTVQAVNVGTELKPESVPMLEEILEWSLQDHYPVLNEIKGEDLRIIKPFLESIQRMEQKYSAKKVQELIHIISFDYDILKEIKKQRPDLKLYWVIEQKDFSQKMIEKAKNIDLTGIDLESCNEVAEYAAVTKDAGLELITWINRKEGTDGDIWAEKMSKLGVDIFTSDLPPSMMMGIRA